jgi:hypothetical protein
MILNFYYLGSGAGAVEPITPVTFSISYSGSQTNKGFTGSARIESVYLPPLGFEQAVMSPILPGLQRGDQVAVTIIGLAGMIFTTTFTS